jgi:hypothetical protein
VTIEWYPFVTFLARGGVIGSEEFNPRDLFDPREFGFGFAVFKTDLIISTFRSQSIVVLWKNLKWWKNRLN